MFNIYLSGEIHTNWRDQIIEEAKKRALNLTFFYPELNHSKSDQVGMEIINDYGNSFINDNTSAKINSIRIQTMIENSHIVIVKFGDKYKQWNAAFDAGYASAKGKKLIIIHDDNINHPLKEIDASASAVVKTESQVIDILEYLIKE